MVKEYRFIRRTDFRAEAADNFCDFCKISCEKSEIRSTLLHLNNNLMSRGGLDSLGLRHDCTIVF